MNWEAIGLTIQTVGTLLIAYAVLEVHAKVGHEHKIDKRVLGQMQKEKGIVLVGMSLIIIGFLIQVYQT